MRECEGDDANRTMWTSSGLQALLRQDDTNGGVSEAFAAEMRYMQSEDSTVEADSHSA